MRRVPGIGLLFALAVAGSPFSGLAQSATPAMTRGEEPLRVFLDCWRCEMDHFRREVAFISYVRDREDAQLHVLVTTQPTGAGGSEYTFNFIGLDGFPGQEDTLTVASAPDDTDDETREDLIRTFKLGLIPFVASTEVGRHLQIDYRRPREEESTVQLEDPWDLWVFRIRVGGEVEGESRESSRSFDGSLSAGRVTEDLKMDFQARGDWSEDEFEFSDGEKYSFSSRFYEVEGTVVWSLGPHWSAGISGSATGSTRQNQSLTLRGGPAVEYNLFPYAESTRRQITFLYKVEAASFDYEEITLFDKTSEFRMTHTLAAASAFNQPWGEIDVSVTGSNFLDDFSQHKLEIFSRLEIRLFRGLSLDIWGTGARVKDQIYAPREDIADEDILLRRKELGTDYRFSFSVGFSYTFGSVFNNVVNPRMSTGGGRGRGWH